VYAHGPSPDALIVDALRTPIGVGMGMAAVIENPAA
jgi:hypothetical protein